MITRIIWIAAFAAWTSAAVLDTAEILKLLQASAARVAQLEAIVGEQRLELEALRVAAATCNTSDASSSVEDFPLSRTAALRKLEAVQRLQSPKEIDSPANRDAAFAWREATSRWDLAQRVLIKCEGGNVHVATEPMSVHERPEGECLVLDVDAGGDAKAHFVLYCDGDGGSGADSGPSDTARP